jgi:hypothetical protein
MTFTLKTPIRDGKIQINMDAPAEFAGAAEVEVSIRPLPVASSTSANARGLRRDDPLSRAIGSCEGPADLAANTDHQLYGFPKKDVR